MPEESLTENQFEDATIGMNIPKNFIPSIEKVMNDVYVYTLVTVHGPKQVELFFEEEFFELWSSVDWRNNLPKELGQAVQV